MARDEMLVLAHKVVAILRPACERIEIAGALRRGAPHPTDIDIVCQPAYEATLNLLGEETGRSYQRFYDALDDLAGLGLEPVKGGPKVKVYRSDILDCSVDIFIVVPPAEWGAILAIRTGPSEFSHLCVTKRERGGALPMNMRQESGALWRGETRLETPEEADWFAALGLPCWEPAERSAARLRRYLSGRWS